MAVRNSFDSLEELIQYYSHDADGLCCTLTVTCPRFNASTPVALSYGTKDEWEINPRQIRLNKRLGPGQFGEMWEGIWNGTTPVAVKVRGTMTVKNFLAEAQFMKKLNHRKLIQLYAVSSMGEPMYIITEVMKNGNLLDYLQKVYIP